MGDCAKGPVGKCHAITPHHYEQRILGCSQDTEIFHGERRPIHHLLPTSTVMEYRVHRKDREDLSGVTKAERRLTSIAYQGLTRL
jgi:hypothetical protein